MARDSCIRKFLAHGLRSGCRNSDTVRPPTRRNLTAIWRDFAPSTTHLFPSPRTRQRPPLRRERPRARVAIGKSLAPGLCAAGREIRTDLSADLSTLARRRKPCASNFAPCYKQLAPFGETLETALALRGRRYVDATRSRQNGSPADRNPANDEDRASAEMAAGEAGGGRGRDRAGPRRRLRRTPRPGPSRSSTMSSGPNQNFSRRSYAPTMANMPASSARCSNFAMDCRNRKFICWS